MRVATALKLSCAFMAMLSASAWAQPAPKLEGMQIDEAENLARDLGITLRKYLVPSLERLGMVVLQIPAEAVDVGPRKQVSVEVSDGVVVPDLTGKQKDEALAALGSLGVSVEFEESQHLGRSRGQVASQVPAAGTKLDASTQVVFLSVAGGRFVVVPDVSGQSLADAMDMLRKGELLPGEDPVDSGYASTSVKLQRKNCHIVTRRTAVATRTEPAVGSEVYPQTGVRVQYEVRSVDEVHHVCPQH